MTQSQLIELGTFVLILIGSLAAFWFRIDEKISGLERRIGENFVRRDVHAERERNLDLVFAERQTAMDKRFITLEEKVDKSIVLSEQTQTIIRGELPKAIQEACTYGLTEGVRILTGERKLPRLDIGKKE